MFVQKTGGWLWRRAALDFVLFSIFVQIFEQSFKTVRLDNRCLFVVMFACVFLSVLFSGYE